MEVHEKRRYPRLPLNLGIKYEIASPQDSETVTTQTKNISAGGICIIAFKKMSVGLNLNLYFFLPDNEKTIQAKGKTAWIQEFSVGNDNNKAYDLGIEFTEIAEADSKRIAKYINLQLAPEKNKE